MLSMKPQTYLVNITILEGRHYVWPNMDSAVIVKIDNKRRCTSLVKSTDSPFYNQYFVFEFHTTFDKLSEKNIVITAIQPKSLCRKRKILGYITLDVATVWNQPDHQFFHKWAILTAPAKDLTTGPRGYLKVDISVLARGENPKIYANVINNEIEGNLLMRDGAITERHRAHFIFDIYKCENLISKTNSVVTDHAKQSTGSPSSFVEIRFAGQTAKTTIKKNNANPEFNERLVITEFFPPLCQCIKVEVYSSDKTLIGSHCIKLRTISNDKEEGFIPTFGPSPLYLYNMNNLEGYAGTVVLSISTIIQYIMGSPGENPVLTQGMQSLNEQFLYDQQDVLLFITIYEATAISKKYSDKAISFRMTFGNVLVQKSYASGDPPLTNATVALKPRKFNRNFYLPIENEKPCLSIVAKFPDLRKRLYNTNMLVKISKELKTRLDNIETVFYKKEHKNLGNEMEALLVDALDYVCSAACKYLDITSKYDLTQATNLDKERISMCIREMKDIAENSKDIYNRASKKRSFRKIEKLYRRILLLTEEAQHSWPDIFLWMVYGNKKVAYFQIPANKIVYSLVEEEAGKYCGKIRTVHLYFHEKVKFFADNACKVRMMSWLGLERHKNALFEAAPGGFRYNRISDDETRPSLLVANEHHNFQCRAHIFQGRFSPGYDRSGLSDPLVHVIIAEQSKETQVIKKTLNPVYDTCLVFRDITLYGSVDHIKNNPPVTFAEVFDRDACCNMELIGRTQVIPVVKMCDDPYVPPLFPPKLHWYKIYNVQNTEAEILAAFEILEISCNDEEDDTIKEDKVPIPEDIKPNLVNHKMEIIFWGVRDLRKINCIQINRPKVTIQCLDSSISSETLSNAKKNLNFTRSRESMDIILPLQEEYAPPLCIKIYDSRSFGVQAFAGIHISQVSQFLFHPLTSEERIRMLSEVNINSFNTLESKSTSILEIMANKTSMHSTEFDKDDELFREERRCLLCRLFIKCCTCRKKNANGTYSATSLRSDYENIEYSDNEDYDWWTKFYASTGEYGTSGRGKLLPSERYKLKVYENELEAQPEFKGFSDTLITFEMYKGKRTGDETVDEENITAIFKGALKIYRWPPEDDVDYVTNSGLPLSGGMFQDFPLNHALRYILRVYCVRAIGLRPKDLNGKSDPYLYLTLNNKVISDKENYVTRQVNPVFGRCFEFNAVFPQDHTLAIAIWDWDLATHDDLIGETKIDLENRYYTKYRAYCGIAEEYQVHGHNIWRDQYKPTVILENLCRKFGLDSPEYGETSVRIGFKEFYPNEYKSSGDTNFDNQVLALTALRRWKEMPLVGFHLVPEHVETRSLYNPAKPGVEQGKLQMWIDIFPCTDLPSPKQINIQPRKPVSYELRVIIWNVEEIKLDEDDFFSGEKKSDIYVKGWIIDPEDAQCTDVHYRSISGEGNFNWRFIFNFGYLSTENKIVVRRKESVFALDETELKFPCKLTLQVWDNDTFSADDFIGTLVMDLSRMPRGARDPKKCKLAIIGPNAPTINLFKIKRTRGWWPFKTVVGETNEVILIGKVEAELEILSAEEAEKSPAGHGRDEPQKLPAPNRPDTSFSWFRNPLKALNYVVCKLHRWKIIKWLLLIFLAISVFGVIYAFPQYTVQRIIGGKNV